MNNKKKQVQEPKTYQLHKNIYNFTEYKNKLFITQVYNSHSTKRNMDL